MEERKDYNQGVVDGKATIHARAAGQPDSEAWKVNDPGASPAGILAGVAVEAEADAGNLGLNATQTQLAGAEKRLSPHNDVLCRSSDYWLGYYHGQSTARREYPDRTDI